MTGAMINPTFIFLHWLLFTLYNIIVFIIFIRIDISMHSREENLIIQGLIQDLLKRLIAELL